MRGVLELGLLCDDRVGRQAGERRTGDELSAQEVAVVRPLGPDAEVRRGPAHLAVEGIACGHPMLARSASTALDRRRVAPNVVIMAETEIMPRPMVLEEFTPHLQKVFRAACVPNDVDLTLTEAYPLKDNGMVSRPPFLLMFHSDPRTLLGEGLYTVRTSGMEPAAIHIAPTVTPPGAPAGHYYQAVFN